MSAEPVIVRTRRCRRILLVLAALLVLPPAAANLPARAEGLTLGGATSSQPIEISADSGIEWQQKAHLYIARGHAVARRGTTEVHADTLTAHYREVKGAGGGTEIYRVDADGHVMIKGEKETVVGDHAIYDVDQGVAVVTGKGLKLTTATDTVTARDSLEWYDQKGIAVARGNALATRGEKRIHADVLTAYTTTRKAGKKTKASGRPGAGAGGEGSQISRVDAHGNVVISDASGVGRADYGVYNAKTGIATLLGNVTLTRGKDMIRGQYAVMDLNTGVSRMMTVARRPGAGPARVEGVFVRQDQTGGGQAGERSAEAQAGSRAGGARKR